jgi:linalool 8-monooxygenase
MSKEQYLGTFILLAVAGNETTRNSLSGGVIALSEFPAKRKKLVENPAVLSTAAAEIVRSVSPIMHMRRTAVVDTELRGKVIRAGDKGILRYASANRRGDFHRPLPLRRRPRGLTQLGCGSGQHYCLDARLSRGAVALFLHRVLATLSQRRTVWPDPPDALELRRRLQGTAVRPH